MMREASEAAADATILRHYGWDDLDRDTFARYRRRFQTAKPDHVANGYSDAEFLQAVNGYRRDREQGIEGLTVAGLLMFGKPEAIREWRTRHLFDFRLLPHDLGSAAEWDDRFLWEGNLLGAFETIYPRLVAGLPIPFRLEGPVRVDETPLHAALREALINLLVHADYAETDGALILRSPEGFYFRNPGNSRVPDVELTLGRHSDPRNPELVYMFRQINLAEEAGSGIQWIIRTWRDLGYRAPAIDAGTERYEFALHLRHLHLFSEVDRAWLDSLREAWDEPEQLAMLIARHEGDVDNLRLRSLTGQHPADTTKTLRSLRDRGLLSMSGWGRGASYQLGPLMTAASRSALAGAPGQQTTSLQDSRRNVEDSNQSPGGFSPNLGDNGPSLQDKGPSLQDIGAPARQRGRLDPAARAEIVVRLCQRAPLTILEMAGLLGRSRAHTRAVVGDLVAAGRLAYAYPDRPNDPRQRYVAASTPGGLENRC